MVRCVVVRCVVTCRVRGGPIVETYRYAPSSCVGVSKRVVGARPAFAIAQVPAHVGQQDPVDRAMVTRETRFDRFDVLSHHPSPQESLKMHTRPVSSVQFDQGSPSYPRRSDLQAHPTRVRDREHVVFLSRVLFRGYPFPPRWCLGTPTLVTIADDPLPQVGTRLVVGFSPLSQFAGHPLPHRFQPRT